MLVKSIIRTKDQAQGVLPIIRGVARIFPEQRTIFQIPLPPPPPRFHALYIQLTTICALFRKRKPVVLEKYIYFKETSRIKRIEENSTIKFT